MQMSYVVALEAERAKMMMFKNELPLSIQLVSQAIDSCRDRLILASGDDVEKQNTCDSLSEETASDDFNVDVTRPVLEFIPMKKCVDGSSSESEEIRGNDCMEDSSAFGKKLDWLSSAQLWNKSPDLPSNSKNLVTWPDELEKMDKCKSSDDKKLDEEKSSPDAKQAESSSTESRKSGGCKKEDKEGSSKRKQRRCWSQDLHRKFLSSLKQLGGAHVATPKQIRELMNVDGLTNDEVKSHLQKYRLHTKRPVAPASRSNAPAPPQFVVVGSIWAPQSDYTTMKLITSPNSNKEENGALGTTRTRVYTPMAAPPSTQPHSWHERRRSFDQKTLKSRNNEEHGDALARCISPSISSSTRTTASQVY